MTAGEVSAMATAAWLAARPLQRLLDIEGVYTAFIGRRIAHVHQHPHAVRPTTGRSW